jgi:hypothetical protein
MRFQFWKKEETVTTPGYAPYEEINAKKTSTLGYFFLLLMVVFGVWQGNNFLSALQRSVTAPVPNSSCLSVLSSYARTNTDYYYDYDNYYYSQTLLSSQCQFSEREKALSLHILYQNIEPNLIAYKEVQARITKIERAQSDASYSRETYITEYEASLLEDIAGTENTVFDQGTIQSSIVTQDDYISRLNEALTTENAEKSRLYEAVKTAVAPYRTTIAAAENQYQHELIVHQFIQFLVSLIFVAPLFALVWRRYHASKKNRSEYAIIWGGLVATSGLLLAEILLMFIYEVLPHRILQAIFDFLAQFEFIWTLLYWLGFILVPLFFGFLIYLIQKKFYNKQAVMMRALKNERCPGCSLKLHHDMNHCPVCGYKIKEHCTACGAMTMRGGGFCASCGANQTPQ